MRICNKGVYEINKYITDENISKIKKYLKQLIASLDNNKIILDIDITNGCIKGHQLYLTDLSYHRESEYYTCRIGIRCRGCNDIPVVNHAFIEEELDSKGHIILDDNNFECGKCTFIYPDPLYPNRAELVMCEELIERNTEILISSLIKDLNESIDDVFNNKDKNSLINMVDCSEHIKLKEFVRFLVYAFPTAYRDKNLNINDIDKYIINGHKLLPYEFKIKTISKDSFKTEMILECEECKIQNELSYGYFKDNDDDDNESYFYLESTHNDQTILTKSCNDCVVENIL